MKKLLLLALIALAAVGGLSIYATKVMGDFHKREQELTRQFAERAEDLRAIDRLFPYTATGKLDAIRFPVYLEIRGNLSEAFRARIAEHARSSFHARETRNDLLRLLRLDLQAKKMSLLEYRFTAARWRALLAREEFADLQASWRATVFDKTHPDGLPLPAPAADATPKELELVRRYSRLLEESMHSDLLAPLLDRVAEQR